MLEFELEVVLIRVRAKADFLDDYLGRIRLHLLRLLFLLVQKFLIVHYLANRRVSLGADFNQIKSKFVSHLNGLGNRINSLLLNILTHKANLRRSDLLIDSQSVLIFFCPSVVLRVRASPLRIRTWAVKSRARWFEWCCDSAVLQSFKELRKSQVNIKCLRFRKAVP